MTFLLSNIFLEDVDLAYRVLLAKLLQYAFEERSCSDELITRVFAESSFRHEIACDLRRVVRDGQALAYDSFGVRKYIINDKGIDEISQAAREPYSDIRFLLESSFDFPLFFHLADKGEPRYNRQLLEIDRSPYDDRTPAARADSWWVRLLSGHDVALSFGGDYRPYVEEVAQSLKLRGVSVFYDRFFESDMWGRDGRRYFERIFKDKARYVVVFASRSYSERPWTEIERQAIVSRRNFLSTDRVLIVRCDRAEIDGIPPEMIYKTKQAHEAHELAFEICWKIGMPPNGIKAPADIEDIIRQARQNAAAMRARSAI
ncbi:TIR domain-containing protein [Sphingomonas oligophenolica]|uniref:TIR domain-containing protein n=1 Tax=Sphingomonas oligophenolica TaxID=301154 RepID=A0A502CPA4_9SPHN|nr:TIR domain-containing protein [Sphingomonas oligophenolica]TPG14360.1 TIR domain-containing protein [Sphingomonas oligophenolica]